MKDLFARYVSNGMNKVNSAEQHQPGQVVSEGYLDESLVLLDLNKHQQVGEAKLPIELGTPTCILAPTIRSEMDQDKGDMSLLISMGSSTTGA